MSWWTDERFEEAKRLWKDGYSAGDIAKVIHAPSRCSVLAKLNRAGLLGGKRTSFPSRSHENNTAKFLTGQPQHRVLRKAKPLPRAAISRDEPEPRLKADGSRITLYEAGWCQCRYIAGEAAEGLICGQQTKIGESWCEYHKRVVWSGNSRPQPQEEKQAA